MSELTKELLALWKGYRESVTSTTDGIFEGVYDNFSDLMTWLELQEKE